jgi:hypothetical protein
MMIRISLCCLACLCLYHLNAQQRGQDTGRMLVPVTKTDTGIQVQGRYIELSEIVLRTDINISDFIRRVQDDTTFYKAFKTLRTLSYTSINDIRMTDKRGDLVASLNSKTHQLRTGDCRTMQTLNEQTTGDIRNDKGDWNYITAELYAGLFFTKGSICGENNIVHGAFGNMEHLSGMDKHKEQLKLLFFNPGKPIPGIPFLGNKMDIFSKDAAELYHYIIDMKNYNGRDCYVFTVKAREDLTSDQRDQIVIDEMTTWFDAKTMEVMGRIYDMSYDAGVYDFNVHMEAQLSKIDGILVPTLLRYNGTWGVVFKKRERGIFTATLYDFGK